MKPRLHIRAKVNETSERMVFAVRSDRFAHIAYRVDLTANKGAGQCSCTDWGTRRWPALKAGAEPWSHDATCKHVRAAGTHLLRGLLKRMAESEET